MTTPNLTQLQQQMASVFRLIQQGNPAQALEQAQGLLRKAPQNPDVVHLTALAHKGLGNLDQAAQYFDRSLTLNKKQPQVHNNLGNLRLSQQHYTAAEKHYRQALKLQSNYPDAQRNLGLCLANQHRYEEAIAVYQSLTGPQSTDASALCANEVTGAAEVSKISAAAVSGCGIAEGSSSNSKSTEAAASVSFANSLASIVSAALV